MNAELAKTGNAYFYNVTDQKLSGMVNGFSDDSFSLNSISDSYTPYVSSGFRRYNGPAQGGQFGPTNKVTYQLENMPEGSMTVTINVDFKDFPIQRNILIYLFVDSVVVTVADDYRAFFGKNGETISVISS